MIATVSVVSVSDPRIGAPTIHVSWIATECFRVSSCAVRLNRFARLVPGPEKPRTVDVVVDPSTTRPGRWSSAPVEKAPGNGAASACTPGPVSCGPVKPEAFRLGKRATRSTIQPFPPAPASERGVGVRMRTPTWDECLAWWLGAAVAATAAGAARPIRVRVAALRRVRRVRFMRVLAFVSGSGAARSDGTYPGARNRAYSVHYVGAETAWLRRRVVAFGTSAARRRGADVRKGRRREARCHRGAGCVVLLAA